PDISVLQFEEVLGGAAEHARDREREWQAGNVSFALDRVDALPGNTDCVRKLLLRPPEPGSVLLHPVAHDRRRRVKHACHHPTCSGARQARLSFKLRAAEVGRSSPPRRGGYSTLPSAARWSALGPRPPRAPAGRPA